MQNDIGKLFLTGLAMGWGPCMGVCLPVILPYIIGTEKGWKKGFIASLVFSISRFAAYMVLGFLAGYAAKLILNAFYGKDIGVYFSKAGAVIIIILGILIALGKDFGVPFCSILRKHIIEKNMKGLVLLGLLTGFSPCAPLMGALAFIIIEAKTGMQGLAYGAAFGLGTILSPVILLGTFAGGVSGHLEKFRTVSEIIGKVCGWLLVLWGALSLLR